MAPAPQFGDPPACSAAEEAAQATSETTASPGATELGQEQADDQQGAPTGPATDSTPDTAALSSSSSGGRYQSVPPSSLWGPTTGVITPSPGTDESEAAAGQPGSVVNHGAEADLADASGYTDGASATAKEAGEGAAVGPDSHPLQDLHSAGSSESSISSVDSPPHRAVEVSLPEADVADSASDAYHAAPGIDDSSAEVLPDKSALEGEQRPGRAKEHEQQQSGAPFLTGALSIMRRQLFAVRESYT